MPPVQLHLSAEFEAPPLSTRQVNLLDIIEANLDEVVPKRAVGLWLRGQLNFTQNPVCLADKVKRQ